MGVAPSRSQILLTRSICLGFVAESICTHSRRTKELFALDLWDLMGPRSLQLLGVWNGGSSSACVQGLKWYTYHCRPSLAMISPWLWFQTFLSYRSFVPRACQHFTADSIVDLWITLVYQCHVKPGNCGLGVYGTPKKDEMNCSIKVWPLVWARSVTVAKPAALWFQTTFYQTVLQEHCKAKTILFSHESPPMPNFLTTMQNLKSLDCSWEHGASLNQGNYFQQSN